MAAVEREDERWQLTLDGMKELSGQYRELLKLTQSGFNSLGIEVDTLRQRLAVIERLIVWAIVASIFNTLGWLIVAGLLVWVLTRLFSI